MHGEIVGSLLVFAVLILAPRRWVRWVAYAVLVVLTYQSYLLAFVGGMVICEIWVVLGDRVRRWTPLLIPVGIYGLLLGSSPIPRAQAPDFYQSLLPSFFGTTPAEQTGAAHIVGAVLVLAAVVAVVPLRRPLDSKALQFLGRISFPLYILHFLVLGSVGAGLLIALQNVLPYTLNALVVTAAVIAVSIGAAWVFTCFVDEPTVRYTGRAERAARARARAALSHEAQSRV